MEKARDPGSLTAATKHLTAAKEYLTAAKAHLTAARNLLVALRYYLAAVRCSLDAVRYYVAAVRIPGFFHLWSQDTPGVINSRACFAPFFCKLSALLERFQYKNPFFKREANLGLEFGINLTLISCIRVIRVSRVYLLKKTRLPDLQLRGYLWYQPKKK